MTTSVFEPTVAGVMVADPVSLVAVLAAVYGRPERGRYGLTATTNGTHNHWLDHPDQHVFKEETTQSNE